MNYNEFKQSYVETDLKSLLAKYNLTQTELSRLTEIPLRTIQNWASGVRKPNSYIVKMIAYILSKEEKDMKQQIIDEITSNIQFSREDIVKGTLQLDEESYKVFEEQVEDLLDPACFTIDKWEEEFTIDYTYQEKDALYIDEDIDEENKFAIHDYFTNEFRKHHRINDVEAAKFVKSLNEDYCLSHHDDRESSYNYEVYSSFTDMFAGNRYEYKNVYLKF